MKRMRASALVMTAIACAVSAAWAGTADLPKPTGYTVRLIELPSVAPYKGGSMGMVYTNDLDVMTVQFSDVNGIWHAALVERGHWKLIDVPGAVQTVTSNPNNLGQVALGYDNGDGVWHSALYCRGKYTPIRDVPGFQLWAVNGINDLGQFCNAGTDVSGHWVGLVGTIQRQTLFTYPATSTWCCTMPFAINDFGVVAGMFGATDSNPPDGGGRHAFQYNTRTGQGSAIPGNTFYANSINNLGDMVVCGTPAVLFRDGTSVPIPMPAILICVWPGLACINDLRQVSGCYLDGADNAYHGFLATPTYK